MVLVRGVQSRSSRLRIIVVLFLLGACARTALAQVTRTRAFCNSPQFKKLTCGIASAEEENTSTNACLYCGNVFRSLPVEELPTEIEGHHTYPVFVKRSISLACKGRVVVRAVFKATQPPKYMGANCTYPPPWLAGGSGSFAGSDETPRVRCELQLPAGPGDEASRAVRAKEVKCWNCDKHTCPAKLGVWYSESYSKVLKGCDDKAVDALDYMHPEVGMAVNTGSKALVAKFEVCSNRGCFDPVYEDNKLKNAIIAPKRIC